jgi:hypothetical protein
MSDKKIVNSIRGEKVDFDLLRLQISNIPESETVKHRENLIQSHRKRKNATKRKIRDMFHQQQINEANMRKALEKQKYKEEIPTSNNLDKSDIDDSITSSSYSEKQDVSTKEPEKFNRKIKGK